MRLFFLILVAIAAATTGISQTGNSEVFLFELSTLENTGYLIGGENISNSPGYDNQPSFTFDGTSLLFTSIRNGNSPDIYEYLLADKTTNQITTSADAEYTPRAKDPDSIYFVREGSGQDMTVWKYDRKTKAETRALAIKEPVAYYDWNANGVALVWIRYASIAHFVDPNEKINDYVADHVLPSSPQRIPGTMKFSFVQRQGNDEVWIKEFDPETRAVRPIVRVMAGKVDYCWMTNGTLLMASGSKLYSFNDNRDDDWVLFADLLEFGLKDITRLAASPDAKMIAVVSNQ